MFVAFPATDIGLTDFRYPSKKPKLVIYEHFLFAVHRMPSGFLSDARIKSSFILDATFKLIAIKRWLQATCGHRSWIITSQCPT